MRVCCGDLFTIHLTAIGICFTIFTLVYSFIVSRKSEIDEYSEELKSKFASPQSAQRYSIATSYIKRMSSVNQKCIVAILCSTFCLMLSWLGYRVFSSPGIIITDFIVINLISVGELAYIVYFLVKIYKQYQQDLIV